MEAGASFNTISNSMATKYANDRHSGEGRNPETTGYRIKSGMTGLDY
jgi:hypothetical protein